MNYAPESASGDIAFSLAASGDGRGQTGSAVYFRTETTEVTEKSRARRLKTRRRRSLRARGLVTIRSGRLKTGKSPHCAFFIIRARRKSCATRAYSDGAGRWFLVDFNPAGATYWASLEGDVLSLEHAGAQFEPFATLGRQ